MPENITSVLIIYTGGTIGMVENSKTGSLEPFNFHHLLDKVPELRQLGFSISTVQFEPPIDSSEIEPDSWVKLVHIIADNYDLFDGFVVLHGTDTMAYTASALSFMLENLNKPVILTGSQLPIGMLRTDGKENLITAIEIAAAKNTNGDPLVPEVCIFFGNHLLRGNRTTKISAESFSAFVSTNYPPLAQAGVHIHYDENQIARTTSKPLRPHYLMNTNIVVLKLFPRHIGTNCALHSKHSGIERCRARNVRIRKRSREGVVPLLTERGRGQRHRYRQCEPMYGRKRTNEPIRNRLQTRRRGRSERL